MSQDDESITNGEITAPPAPPRPEAGAPKTDPGSRVAAWNERALRLLIPSTQPRSPVWRYGLALLVVAAATVLRRALVPWMGDLAPYNITFVAVVVVMARLGFGPALFALVVGDAAVEIFVVGHSSPAFDAAAIHRFGVSFAAGLFFCYLLHALKVSQVDARLRSHAAEEEIAARKRIEQELRDSEEHYRALAENSPDLIARFDRELRLAYANPAVLERTATATERLVGNTAQGYGAAPASASAWEQAARRALETGKPQRFEHTSVWQRQARTYDAVAVPERGADGTVTSIMSVARDITEKKEAEEALRLSEEKFAKAFGGNTAAMAITRLRDGLFIDVNERYLEITRWVRGDVVGKSSPQLNIWKHPGDRDRFVRDLQQHGMVRNEEFDFVRKGGDEWTGLLSSQVSVLNGEPIIISSIIDITDRKRADAALVEAHGRTTAILESIADAFYSLDDQWRFVVVNPAAERAPFGRPAAELLGKVIWDVFPRIVGTRIHQHYVDAVVNRTHEHYEAQSPLNGRWYEVLMFPRAKGLDVYLRDIDARKKAEVALRESEQRLQQAHELVEAVTQGTKVLIATVDKDFRYTFFNKEHHEELRRLTGKETAIGMSLSDVLAHTPEERDKALALWGRAVGGETVNQTLTFGDPGRYRRWYSTRHAPIRDADGVIVGAGEVTSDVTELMRAQETLQEKEATLRGILDATQESIWLFSRDGAICMGNQTAMHRLGKTADQILGKHFRELMPAEVANKRQERLTQVVESGQPVEFEDQRDGIVFLHTFYPVLDGDERVSHVAAFSRDITASKRADEALKRAHDELDQKVRDRTSELETANRTLRMISQCNEVLVRATDEIDLVQSICRIIHAQGNYRMVWVGYAENDPAKTVRPVAAVGFEEGYLEQAHITWADEERGSGPTGTCIRTATVRVCCNFFTDPTLLPWRDQAVKRGYQSSIALPLRKGSQVFGALTLYAAAPSDFGEGQVSLLTELADDMALGIMTLRLQVERDHARQVAEGRAQQLRALASELTLAEQRERQRLAQLLHDGLQQLLVGARFRMGTLERAKDPRVRHVAGEVDALLAESIESSRSLTYELCPPILRQGGLVVALEWLVHWMRDKHGLTVHLKTKGDVAPAAEDATILLFQATRELLFNVVKHSGVKTARVELFSEGKDIQILIADAGAGFDSDRIRTAGGSVGGFGLLGLSERLALVGGRLEIDSAPGHGSRFTLVAPIPILPASATAVRDNAKSVAPVRVSRRRRAKTDEDEARIRVMLVDDHVVMRQGLAQLLRAESDVEIVGEVADGKSAIELVRTLRPAVVLMDVNMPGMNGVEATEVIHAEVPDTQVIGLSMLQEEEQAAAMRQAGAVAYFAKTAPPADLIAAIRSFGKPTRRMGRTGRAAKKPKRLTS